MRIRVLLISCLICCLASPALAADALQTVLQGQQRSAANQARDIYRHPYETLMFFGLRDDMAVAELWPGGGWYTEILAPFLKAEGRYIAAHFNSESKHQYADYFKRSRSQFEARMAAESEIFGKDIEIVAFEPGVANGLPADASLDMVLTFRNAHNWMKDGKFDAALSAVYAALKPGGVFGVVDHRAAASAAVDPASGNGYVNEWEMIRLLEAAGFKFVARSEVNANSKDSADHPNGVWTLPPVSRVPEGDDGTQYAAIGESDRMTLKFIKPY